MFLCLYPIFSPLMWWSWMAGGNGVKTVPHLHSVNSKSALDAGGEWGAVGDGKRRRKIWRFSWRSSFYIFSEQRTSKLLRHKPSSRPQSVVESSSDSPFSLFSFFTHFSVVAMWNFIFCCAKAEKNFFCPRSFFLVCPRLQKGGKTRKKEKNFCRKNRYVMNSVFAGWCVFEEKKVSIECLVESSHEKCGLEGWKAFSIRLKSRIM